MNENSLDAWYNMFIFTYQCLVVPDENRCSSLTSKILTAIRNFPGIPPKLDIKKKKRIRQTSEELLRRQICSRLEDNDTSGAARLASSNTEPVLPTADTANILAALHPKIPGTLLQDVTPTESLKISRENILLGVSSFPPGSSAGLDGLRPQHLKDMINRGTGEAGSHLVDMLTAFTNWTLAGNINPEIRPFFFGARLCGLTKPGGGIRPIAVSNTLRRLVSKVANRAVLEKAGNLLYPTQLGCGTQQGGEAVVHAIRTYCKNMEGNNEMVLLKVDFKNAFNSVHRKAILKEVHSHFPELYNYVWSAYGAETSLMFGDHMIPSCCGVQQGDPLGPLLFCLALLPISKSIQSPVNIWYMDDGTLGGTHTQVSEAFNKLKEECEQIGLVVNPKKCEFVHINHFNDLLKFPGIPQTQLTDLSILGSPIGSKAMDTILEDKQSKLEKLIERLVTLPAHYSLHLLRFCFGLPKLLYILRNSPCYKSPLLTSWDSIIRNGLEKVLNVQLSDEAWEQASLPVNYGGLGVRAATSIALPAFISSAISCSTMVSHLLVKIVQDPVIPFLEEAKGIWKSLYPTLQEITTGRQKDWDLPGIIESQKKLLERNDDIMRQARLRAVFEEGSGMWLHATPSPSLGLFLDDTQLRIACGLRLGVPLHGKHTCSGCGTLIDESSTHGLACVRSAGRLFRHGAVNEILRRALVTANVPCAREPIGLARSDGKRPDGVTHVPWEQGKCLIWDFTCPDTLAPTYLNMSSSRAGAVAAQAEVAKKRKYESFSRTHCFVPIAIETLGPLGPEGARFLKQLGKKLVESTGEPNSRTWLLQRVSIAIQRGNAASLIGTLPIMQEVEL